MPARATYRISKRSSSGLSRDVNSFSSAGNWTRRKGLQRGQTLPLALDPTPILGRGTAKQFYNLQADAISPLLRILAQVQDG